MKNEFFKIYLDLFLEKLNKFSKNLKSLYPEKKKKLKKF